MMKRTDSIEPSGNPSNTNHLLAKRKKRAGITMVETMVSLSIFAIFTVGSCKLLMSHRRVSDMARAHYTASNVAKNRLEEVRTFEFDQLTLFGETNVVVDASGLSDTDGSYRRSTSVNSITNNLCEVVVTVDIRDRQTLAFSGRQEIIQTYIAEYLESE